MASSKEIWKYPAPVGRPPIFKTPEDLWKAAVKYFKWNEKNPWFMNVQLKKPVTIKDEKGKESVITIEKVPTARPMTIKAMCIYLNINEDFFHQLEKKYKEIKEPDETEKEFSRIIARIKDVIYTHKFEGAAVGAFKENLIARELGLKDHQALSDPDGNPLQAPVVNVQTISMPTEIAEKEDEEITEENNSTEDDA